MLRIGDQTLFRSDRTGTFLKKATEQSCNRPVQERPEENDENPTKHIWWREHPLIPLENRQTEFADRPEWEIDGASNDG